MPLLLACWWLPGKGGDTLRPRDARLRRQHLRRPGGGSADGRWLQRGRGRPVPAKYPAAKIVWLGDDRAESEGHPGDLAVARPFDAYELIGAASDATFLRAASGDQPIQHQQQYRAAN